MTVGLRWCVVGVLLYPRAVCGQDSTAAGHFHIGLTIHDVGVSIGNAPRVTGIRINVQDAALERVTGLNLTLWKPREPLTGTVNGVQAGVLPGSAVVNGIAVGIAGVVTGRRGRWVTVGGLGAVSNGDIQGIVVGGLGTVANRDIAGIAVAGLGTVADGGITSLSAGSARWRIGTS